MSTDIVLSTRQYQAEHGLREFPPSHMPEPREFNLDGTQGLVDLSWNQRVPQIQQDDINKDSRYSQYPYQEADERTWRWKNGCRVKLVVPERLPQCPYCHPEATYAFSMADQTLGSPRSIHTDTDAAMEMGGLSVSSTWSDSQKVSTWMEAPRESIWMLSTPDLVTSITKSSL